MIEDELLRLDDVCVKYFGLKPNIARRKSALGTLPIPAFRLAGHSRGPLFVKKSDLDALIESRAAKAAELNKKMRLAGAL